MSNCVLPPVPGRRRRALPLDADGRLLVALPVNGGDGGRALELEVAAGVDVGIVDVEAQAEGGRVEAAARVGDRVADQEGRLSLEEAKNGGSDGCQKQKVAF